MLNSQSINLSTNKFEIWINTETKYGWFEDNIFGDENGGGLWFDEDMKLKDYDGVYFLPTDVRNQLMRNNFITQEMYEDSSSS
jgi:hypothetical protein